MLLTAATFTATPAHSADTPPPTPDASDSELAELRTLLDTVTDPTTTPTLVDEDSQLLAATSDLPGFAGMWVDDVNGQDVVTVAVTPAKGLRSLSTKQLATRIESHFTEQDSAILTASGAATALVDGAELEVETATYTFAQLKKWQDVADTTVGDKVVFSDADERANTVTLGVSSAGEKKAVFDEVAAAGVPVNALKVVEADLGVTLRDADRPVVGGQQIQFQSGGGTYNCTLGLSAQITNTATPVNGYLTNSHCTSSYAAVDNTYHWQPSISSNTANRIGYEALDPSLFTGNPYGSTATSCPSGFQCRLSDAAFGVYTGSFTSTERGYIARPAALRNLNWNGTDRYRITSTSVPTGSVRAVGRTSGMSTGTITQSCVRISSIQGMPGVSQNCQYMGTYSSQGGDSGGPVFRVTNSPSTNDVSFVGLNWGGGTVNGQAVGIVSSWANMQVDFQPYAFRVCHSSFSC